MTADVAPATPGRLARQRRRLSAARFWRSYRTHRAGVIGLAALVLFALMALTAPLTVGSGVAGVTDAPGDPLQAPSLDFPLGTDRFGRSVLGLVVWGSRVSLLVQLKSQARPSAQRLIIAHGSPTAGSAAQVP